MVICNTPRARLAFAAAAAQIVMHTLKPSMSLASWAGCLSQLLLIPLQRHSARTTCAAIPQERVDECNPEKCQPEHPNKSLHLAGVFVCINLSLPHIRDNHDSNEEEEKG